VNIKRSIVLRVRIAFLLVFLLAALIVYRLAHLQFVENEKWAAKAESLNFQYKEVKATRGNIYAADGSLLATSLPFYRVVLDPMVVKEEAFRAGLDSLSFLLSSFYKDKSALAYKKMIADARSSGKRYLIINRRQINYQEMHEMAQWPIFRLKRSLGGVIFEKVEKRYKPFNKLASRTVGFINEDKKGVGIEFSLNSYLEGKNGRALFQRIAGGSYKPVFDMEDIKPSDGFDVITTLDVNIQDVAESALLRQLINKDAEFGAVVVMEVSTGQIKALINLQKNKGSLTYGENYNYAVAGQGVNESGSTFKLVSMLALLEEGKVSLSDKVDTGEGVYKIYDRRMTDSKTGGFGEITVRDVFEKSSNIGVSKLMEENFGHNPSKFMSYIDKVHLTKPIGFQLQGEGIPYFKKPGSKNWYGTTLAWMSIGYEAKVTPLQTLMVYNAVANNGKMVKPYIIKAITKGNHIEKEFDTEVLVKKIASDRTIKQLQSLLEGVVENGTARNIYNNNYKIAGKTGTAQKVVNGRYTQKYYTSFAGYFPAERPKYSMIVIIDSPVGFNAYGGDVSAPVFKEIADKINAQDIELNDRTKIIRSSNDPARIPFVHAGKFEELRMICNRLGISNHLVTGASDSWVKPVTKNKSIEWKATQVADNKVPDVSGFSLKDALYVLENRGLRVNYQGKGKVLNQSVPAGSNVNHQQTIHLILG
jgi:cell division protein FtsI (penicillin-binding protein 3)